MFTLLGKPSFASTYIKYLANIGLEGRQIVILPSHSPGSVRLCVMISKALLGSITASNILLLQHNQ